MGRPRKSFGRIEYCQYLLSSQVNYTLTNYAEDVSDIVRLYLKRERLTASDVWRHVKSDIVMSDSAFIVFDDTILDKSHSRHIESVRWQYSGNAHVKIEVYYQLPQLLGSFYVVTMTSIKLKNLGALFTPK